MRPKSSLCNSVSYFQALRLFHSLEGAKIQESVQKPHGRKPKRRVTPNPCASTVLEHVRDGTRLNRGALGLHYRCGFAAKIAWSRPKQSKLCLGSRLALSVRLRREDRLRLGKAQTSFGFALGLHYPRLALSVRLRREDRLRLGKAQTSFGFALGLHYLCRPFIY